VGMQPKLAGRNFNGSCGASFDLDFSKQATGGKGMGA
jgi:hypothetical protein